MTISVAVPVPILITTVKMSDLVSDGLELSKADLGGLARLPLLQQLPDAGNNTQPGLEGKTDLLADQGV